MEWDKRSKQDLQSEIIDLILNSVNLRHKDKSSVNGETALVGAGLGLDSLDILEIAVAMEKKYDVKIEGSEQGKQIFKNIGTLTDFIATHTSETTSH